MAIKNIKLSNGQTYSIDADVVVDPSMSDTSANAVENKVIKSYVDTGLEAKQNITDNTLTTTAKTIPTAINEVNANLSSHTSNTNNPHSVTKEQVGLGSVVNAGQTSSPTKSSNEYFTAGGAYTLQQSLNSSISTKQDKTDSSLTTTSKEIVGAINELKTSKYTKPTEGIGLDDLSSSVQASLSKADTAIQQVKTINGLSIVGEGNLVIGDSGASLPALPEDAATKTYVLKAVNGVFQWVEEAAA